MCGRFLGGRVHVLPHFGTCYLSKIVQLTYSKIAGAGAVVSRQPLLNPAYDRELLCPEFMNP